MTESEQLNEASYLQRLLDDWEFAQAVIVAGQLGVADLLSGGPRSVTDLAQETGTHAPSLYRLLRYLAGRSVFAEAGDGLFSLTTFAQPLRSDVPDSIRAEALWAGSDAYQRTWNNLSYSVRTGRSAFEHVYGRPFFEYLPEDPALAKIFNDVMTVNSADEGPAIVDGYDFSRFRKIVDVGGGHGGLLALILDRCPQAVGVLFDSPDVVASVSRNLDPLVAAGRMEKVEGDFFKAVPPDGDAYVLKFIVHDWDDEQAVSILKNCRVAMAPDGTVLIIEMVVEEGDAGSAAKELDITMLLFTRGRERTEKEYGELLHRAGLRLVRGLRTRSPFSVIEAVAT